MRQTEPPLRGQGAERVIGLARVAVLHQFHAQQQAQAAHVADGFVALLQFQQAAAQVVALPAGAPTVAGSGSETWLV
ncbi:hypothetical protein CNMCM8686_000111 [Aspergillus fumigatus]|nr:hypothetical protein CNMCM8686_000111 [Aspergillus fumigatus]